MFAARGADPKPPAVDQQTVDKTVTIEPGESVEICRLAGRRAISQIHVVPDSADDNPIRTLRELALSITWGDDTQPAVWAPLGDFFGTAPGINRFKSIPTGMTEDGFYAYGPDQKFCNTYQARKSATQQRKNIPRSRCGSLESFLSLSRANALSSAFVLA